MLSLLRKALLDNGIINTLYFTRGDHFLDVAPPLTITEVELGELVLRIGKAMEVGSSCSSL